MEEVIIPIVLFVSIFGIVYVYLMTRNKERMAMIEKGRAGILYLARAPKFHVEKPTAKEKKTEKIMIS